MIWNEHGITDALNRRGADEAFYQAYQLTLMIVGNSLRLIESILIAPPTILFAFVISPEILMIS
jgi:hypothetical protein